MPIENSTTEVLDAVSASEPEPMPRNVIQDIIAQRRGIRRSPQWVSRFYTLDEMGTCILRYSEELCDKFIIMALINTDSSKSISLNLDSALKLRDALNEILGVSNGWKT